MRVARAVVDALRDAGTEIYGVTTGVGMRKSFRDRGRRARPASRAAAPDRPGRACAARRRSRDRALRGKRSPARNDARAARARPARRRAAQRGPTPCRAFARLDRPGRPRSAGRPRRRAARRIRAGRAARRSRCSTRTPSRRRGGRIALADALTLLDTLDVAGALDLEAFAANRDALHPAVADARPYPGLARDARAHRRAARGECGRAAEPAGPTQLPHAAAGSRRRARCAAIRARPGGDRAQRHPVEPARRRRRRPGRLGGQLRGAAARDRARRRAPRAGTGADERCGAGREAAPGVADGAARGSRRPLRGWPRARSASSASPCRHSPRRRACSPSPSRWSPSRPPRRKASRIG